MKVLYLTNVPSPYRVEFLQELGKLCELTVLYEMEAATDRNKDWKSYNVEERTFQEEYLKRLFSFSSSAFCPSVRTYLKSGDYDVIIIGGFSTPTGMFAIRYMKRKKISYMISTDGGFIRPCRTFIDKFKKEMRSYFLKGAKAYLSPSKITDDYLIDNGCKQSNIYRYPFTSLESNDILEKPISEEEKKFYKNKLGINQDKMVLYVGQFIKRKGIDFLLESIQNSNPKVAYYFIGGHITEEYQKIIEKKSLTHIYFMDFMDKNNLKEYFLAADLFVLPTREDIWGLVINEAMAAGLPVITTKGCVAGLELLSNNQNIVEVDNDIELGNAINTYMSNFELCQEEANRNLKTVQNYTFENMAKKHIEIIHQVYSRKILFCGSNVPESWEYINKNVSAAGNRFQNNMLEYIRKNSTEVFNLSYIGFPMQTGTQNPIEDFSNWEIHVKNHNLLKEVISFYRSLKNRILDFDIIMCYNLVYVWFYLPFTARKYKKQSILILADYTEAQNQTSLVKKVYAHIQLYAMKKFDKIIGLSCEMEHKLKHANFHLMEGGIHREVWEFFSDNIVKSRNDGKIRILYSGLLNQVAGIYIFFEMISLIINKDIEFVITGKGDADTYIDEVCKNDKRVKYMGHLTYDKYLDTIQSCDLLINPRDMNLEENQNNFPSKIMDYLASGKPIISTKFAGWEKFKGIIYFSDSSAESLRDKVLMIKEQILEFDEDNRRKDLLVRREFAKQYLWSSQIHKILEN